MNQLLKYIKKNNSINKCYNCGICKENFIENLSRVITIQCGHTFCQTCLRNLFYKNLICPKCPICNYFVLGVESQIKIKEMNDPSLNNYSQSQSDNSNTISPIQI